MDFKDNLGKKENVCLGTGHDWLDLEVSYRLVICLCVHMVLLNHCNEIIEKKMWLEINKQKNNWNRYGSRGGSMCHFVYTITQNVMTFNVMLGKGLSCSNGQFVRLNGGSGADSRVFAWSSVCVNAKHLKMWPCEYIKVSLCSGSKSRSGTTFFLLLFLHTMPLQLIRSSVSSSLSLYVEELLVSQSWYIRYQIWCIIWNTFWEPIF